MNTLRQIFLWACILIGLVVAGYVGYLVYNYMVEDATQRIRKGVSQGVSEGIGEGVGKAINPMDMAKKLMNNQ